MSNITVTLVSGQTAVVGATSSREAYEVEVSSGIAGAAGVSVVSADIVGGMLNLTLSNTAVVNAGSVMGIANTGTITFSDNIIAQLSNGDVNIQAGANVYAFGDTGLTFPDGTIQTTAFTGSVASSNTLNANNADYLGGIAADQYAYANQINSTTDHLTSNGYTVTLQSNGVVAFPNGYTLNSGTIFSPASNAVGMYISRSYMHLPSGAGSDKTVTLYNSHVSGNGIMLMTTANGEISTQHYWHFRPDGTFRFPDNTIQTTAYTGTSSTDRLTNGSYTAVLETNGSITIPGALTTGLGNNVGISTSHIQREPATAAAGSGNNVIVIDTTNARNVFAITPGWTVGYGSNTYTVTSTTRIDGQHTYTIDVPGMPFIQGPTYTFTNPTPVTSNWSFSNTGSLVFPDGTGQTTAFTSTYDQLTLGFPRIPRSTATNAIHAVDISNTNNNRDGIVIYDTGDGRVKLFADGVGWYTFATTDDVATAAVDRLTSGSNTITLQANGQLTLPTYTVDDDVFTTGSIEVGNGHIAFNLYPTNPHLAPPAANSTTKIIQDGIEIPTLVSFTDGGYLTMDPATARISSNGSVVLWANNGAGGGWTFASSNTGVNTLTFPDDTVQTTAFTGSYDQLTTGFVRVPQYATATNIFQYLHPDMSRTGILYVNQSLDALAYWAPTANAFVTVQTTAGLSSNVATLTSNNTLYLGGTAANQYTTYSGSYTWSGNQTFTGNVAVGNINSEQHAQVGHNITGVPAYSGAGSNTYIWMNAALSNTNTQAVIAIGDITGWTITAEDNPSITATVISMNPVGYWGVGTNVNLPYAAGRTFKFTSPDYAPAYVGPVNIVANGHTWTFGANGSLKFADNSIQNTAFTGNAVFANNTSYLGGVAANQYAYANQVTAYTLPTATTTTLGGVKVDGSSITITSGVISATQPNLSGYQTTAGLSGNVATLTSNNASYLGGVAAANYLVTNTAISTGNVSVNGNITLTGNLTGNTAGFEIGYKDVPQNYTNTSFTLALSDRGKHIFTSNGTAQTITIANNATVAFPIGTAITIVTQGVGVITVARGAGVTMYLAANNTSADRTISSYGMATLLKVATDTWFINGTGVS